jgi:Rieske Fe-S protein
MTKTRSEQETGAGGCCSEHSSTRRSLLRAAIGLGASLPFLDLAHAQAKGPKEARPAAGDQFVYVQGDKKGEVVQAADLQPEVPQLAWPMDPATKTVRDGARLNQVVLVRLDPAKLAPDTKPESADGVVAYSAICTHQGCDVSQWQPENKKLLCVCHRSEFDPTARAKVTFGPAPRRLPILPIKVQDGTLMVAGAFKGKVGFSDM